MTDLMYIDLTEHERDLLLKGLRFVRRSIMLEMREPSAQDTLRRSGLLDEVQNLSQRLEASEFSTTADV